MKKHLNYSTLFAAIAGVLGALLHRWVLSAGVDSNGLYPAGHPGWVGYLVLSVAAMAALWLATREVGEDPTWKWNFPYDLSGDNTPRFYLGFAKIAFRASGYALAGVSIGIHTKFMLPGADLLSTAVYWGGFASMAVLLILSVQCFAGKPPVAIAHMVPCAYFMLLLFLMGKDFSAEPELLRFLPQVAAIAASALACYQLWGFAVDSGNRKTSLFWSLSAAYLCLAAIPASKLYIGLALWHLLSHCTLALPPVAPEETAETPIEEPPAEKSEEETL